MSLTGDEGGYMVPFHLDPAILLSSAGQINPIRQISRVVTTASDSWNGVSSAGATSEWLAEATEAADGSPVLAQPNIPIHKFATDVPFSYEVGMDGANFLQELQMVMVDSVDVLQGLSFVSGSGTGQPTGIITALDGGASEVAAATVDVFAVADILALQNALPARFSARAQWAAQISTINEASSFETTNGALRFPEIADGRLLRKPLHEASQMDAFADVDITETDSNNHILVYGDWTNYVIADRIGATFEVLPGYGANQRPSGERHAFLWGRVGADSIVDNAFRVLSVVTAA
jgi:HK97 family phage major capsid protein